MLGLSYGTQQLVLPNWRVEGADEPFVVRMFPGWNSHVLYPFWMLASFSFVVVTFLASSLFAALVQKGWIFLFAPHWCGMVVALLWSIWSAISYRKALFDMHETFRQWFARIVSGLLRVTLESNFEYVLYRARLAVFEIQRQKIRLHTLRRLLIFIEDRDFYKHKGISYRALARAAAGVIWLRRRSGGSTITQQLARTLFIRDYHKTMRRKFIEILLARWLEDVLPKEEILDIYLASVRFEKFVYGTLSAMHYFFGKLIEDVSLAQAFFLVERVSNIRPRILEAKVDETLRNAVEFKVLSQKDATAVIDIYSEQVKDGRLTIGDKEAFKRLCDRW
jgi:penicillin-binding protein 1A